MAFQLGKLMCTAAINTAMREPKSGFEPEVREALQKYICSDWGECDKEDWRANDEALELGNRILASYTTSKGKIWIITEANRSYTTILFPSDY